MSDSEYDEDFEDYDDDFEDEDTDFETPTIPANHPVVGTTVVSPDQLLADSHSLPDTNLRNSRTSLRNVPKSDQPWKMVLGTGKLQLRDSEREELIQKLRFSLKKQGLVTLGATGYTELLTKATLSLHDLYTMGRGNFAGNKVATTQTNDDDREKECQTVEVTTQDMLCQVPDDMATSSAVTLRATSSTAIPAPAPIMREDAGQESRLNTFLRAVLPLVLQALNSKGGSSSHDARLKDNGSRQGDTSSSQHMALPQLSSRLLKYLTISNDARSLLACAYSPPSTTGAEVDCIPDDGCICLWNTCGIAECLLLSSSAITCCCFGPPEDCQVLVAGLDDGALCCWDLRDLAVLQDRTADSKPQCLRPDYSTQSVSETSSLGAIVDIRGIPGGGQEGVFRVAAIDQWGHIMLQSVVDLMGCSEAAASADVALRPGGRVKLVKVVNISVSPSRGVLSPIQPDSVVNSIQATCLDFIPGPKLQLLVGTHTNRVVKVSTVGVTPSPKEYLAREYWTCVGDSCLKGHPIQVTSVQVSPCEERALLVGSSDGSLALYNTRAALPVLTWFKVMNGPCVRVRWSPTSACSFFALDARGTLHAFDLKSSTAKPTASKPCVSPPVAGNTSSAAVDFHVQDRCYAGWTCMALAYGDGSVSCELIPDPRTANEDDLLLLRKVIGLPA